MFLICDEYHNARQVAFRIHPVLSCYPCACIFEALTIHPTEIEYGIHQGTQTGDHSMGQLGCNFLACFVLVPEKSGRYGK